jgi:hypothetical protein
LEVREIIENLLEFREEVLGDEQHFAAGAAEDVTPGGNLQQGVEGDIDTAGEKDPHV